jgi:hypothetical protein
MTAKTGTWTFFWDAAGVQGEEEGDGAGCIKSPDDATCGCENSDGTFVPGGSACVQAGLGEVRRQSVRAFGSGKFLDRKNRHTCST